MNFVVGVAHLRDGYLIKQGISFANALPSLIWRDFLGESGIVVVNRGGFGICGLNPINNEISSANVKPLLVRIDKRFPQNENCRDMVGWVDVSKSNKARGCVP